MKKIFLTAILSISAIGLSYGQTENNEKNPDRKRVPKEKVNVNSGNIQKVQVESVKTEENVKNTEPEIKREEAKPVRDRQKMRPAPKAVQKIEPVQKTEKTVE